MNDFMLELFNHIADYDPQRICTKTASKYVREYWEHKNIKICVIRNKIDREIISITLTKL